MALTGYPFPYDINNLLGGAVRILVAEVGAVGPPADPGVPGSIADVIDLKTPYAAKPGWTELGATKEAFSYSRSFETEGWEIQNTAGNVIEEITDLSRTIECSVAEFRPDAMQMIENAPNVADVAAVANESAQKVIAFGSFTSLKRYRFAFIARRSIQSGVVEETAGGVERGRYFMGALYTAQISADEVSFEQSKGELSAVGVTFTAFPEPGEPTGEEWGAWYDEQAGLIPAV